MHHFSWFTHLNLDSIQHVLSSLLIVVLLVLAALKVRRHVSKDSAVLPEDRFTITNLFELLVLDFLMDLLTGIFGSREQAERFLPILGTAFIFIMFINLFGLVPGFLPPSGNFNTTVAMAIVIFVMYNFYGFREHGISYLKQFAGPIIWLAPLMIVIEIVSHIVRPVSLSLRLFWNMTGDHLVLGIFTDMTHILIPVIFFALGIFISMLQAFVFTILSAIYMSLAVSHEH